MNLKQKIKISGFVLGIFMLAMIVIGLIFKDKIAQFITYEIETSGMITLAIISFLLELIPQPFVSTHALILQTYLFGFPLITTSGLILLASILGSVVGFEIGHKYKTNLTSAIYTEKEQTVIHNKVDKYGKYALMIAAISPLPYLPIIFGALGIKRKTFLTYGVITRIIGIVIIFTLFFAL